MSSPHVAFTPSATAIVLVDHQPGVLAMVKSLPAVVVTANAATLARLGEQMGIPLVSVVVTTTYGVLCELYPDLSTSEGQRAEGVAVASVAAA